MPIAEPDHENNCHDLDINSGRLECRYLDDKQQSRPRTARRHPSGYHVSDPNFPLRLSFAIHPTTLSATSASIPRLFIVLEAHRNAESLSATKK